MDKDITKILNLSNGNERQYRPPANKCVLCEKELSEVGGKRIVAQQLRGVALSSKYRGGGNPKFPHQSFEIGEGGKKYLVVWGEKEKWTPEAIGRAKQAYLTGDQPWFCQVCGERACRECGQPINMPMGSDVLYDSGCSSHVPIIGFDPGCINPDCEKYKKFGNIESEDDSK